MNLSRLYHTLRPLRAVQWWGRAIRPIKARLLRPVKFSLKYWQAATDFPQAALPLLPTPDSFNFDTGEAFILNCAHRFPGGDPDWNFSGHGALWTYHLNYFGWLESEDLQERGTQAMLHFCEKYSPHHTGADIYPTSRRIRHWIAFMVRDSGRNYKVCARLHADAWRVARLPETHLQANHLLQNGLALLAAAHFFGDARLLRRARRILRKELAEQFLPDGAHIERSASYTADLLGGLLWLLALLRYSPWQAEPLEPIIASTAGAALAWLEAFSFEDGTLAAIGDSSQDMAPSLSALRSVARELEVAAPNLPLRESNYRKAWGEGWEAVINVGGPAPAHQPGHSHADALSFCLHAGGQPLIVDTGISTYERNARRLYERSTAAHNTACYRGESSSDVWASFRVGRRASVIVEADETRRLSATHDGYSSLGLIHQRSFDWSSPKTFLITDRFSGGNLELVSIALHFHPGVALEKFSAYAWRANNCTITATGMAGAVEEAYEWAEGFNLLRPARRLRFTPAAAETAVRLDF